MRRGRLPPTPGAEPAELGVTVAAPRAVVVRARARAHRVLFGLMWNTTTRDWIQPIDDAWLRLMRDLRWQPRVTVAEVLAFGGGIALACPAFAVDLRVRYVVRHHGEQRE